MTKDEAKAEALRRWRELPEAERHTYQQAQVFAAGLASELDFRTMGNERKVIAAWLVNELDGVTETPGQIPSVNRESKPQEDDSTGSNRQEADDDDQGRSRAGSDPAVPPAS